MVFIMNMIESLKMQRYSYLFFAFRTTHLNLNTTFELAAFDETSIVLSCRSMASFVLNITLIIPFLPGRVGEVGLSTSVQLHSTLVSLITRGWLPVLVNEY